MFLSALFLAVVNADSIIFSNATYHNFTSDSCSPTLQSIAPSKTSVPVSCPSPNLCDSLTQDYFQPEEPFFDDHGCAYDNPYYSINDIDPNTNATLRAYFAAKFTTSLPNWFATAPETPGAVIPETTVSAKTAVYWDPGSFQHYHNHRRWPCYLDWVHIKPIHRSGPQYMAAYTPVSYVSQFSFTASQLCCFNCTLYGGDIQVYHWPTATSEGATSTLVNSEGFTL